MEKLREERERGVTERRHAEMVDEATVINDQLRAHVADELATLRELASDLERRAGRLSELRTELAAARTPSATPSS